MNAIAEKARTEQPISDARKFLLLLRARVFMTASAGRFASWFAVMALILPSLYLSPQFPRWGALYGFLALIAIVATSSPLQSWQILPVKRSVVGAALWVYHIVIIPQAIILPVFCVHACLRDGSLPPTLSLFVYATFEGAGLCSAVLVVFIYLSQFSKSYPKDLRRNRLLLWLSAALCAALTAKASAGASEVPFAIISHKALAMLSVVVSTGLFFERRHIADSQLAYLEQQKEIWRGGGDIPIASKKDRGLLGDFIRSPYRVAVWAIARLNPTWRPYAWTAMMVLAGGALMVPLVYVGLIAASLLGHASLAATIKSGAFSFVVVLLAISWGVGTASIPPLSSMRVLPISSRALTLRLAAFPVVAVTAAATLCLPLAAAFAVEGYLPWKIVGGLAEGAACLLGGLLFYEGVLLAYGGSVALVAMAAGTFAGVVSVSIKPFGAGVFLVLAAVFGVAGIALLYYDVTRSSAAYHPDRQLFTLRWNR